jgi:membrane-bound ClpP family serine protease
LVHVISSSPENLATQNSYRLLLSLETLMLETLVLTSGEIEILFRFLSRVAPETVGLLFLLLMFFSMSVETPQ